MSQQAINKSSLAKQRNDLRLYRRFLPSLDLKKKQLLTEQKSAQRRLAELEEEMERLKERVQRALGEVSLGKKSEK